ncbi:diphosphate--fructose-6-phosphate 1-phosphotransferase [Gracilibacillus alcaliphilus]|uniref:diphosphate--fructose-6-phosphate 1-phosphotransferase n=1 Tax=Gracilibacillus alcaliphilus TaxID=1401441 RepID=UPI001959F398|nr:diphosphate--fructose-6-phosphate 1-phosphotransferase [Gracilibacillus alcaliphilus]MBM7677157.1 6-phosphofructokinase 1 [Gracilibacillus alcaliphilus]
MKRINVMIGQSGGPTPVINHSVLGFLESSLNSDLIDKIYGVHYGIEGLLSNNITVLNHNHTAIKQSTQQPGAVLRTSRHPLKEEELAEIFTFLQKLKVKIFCYIGGNGSSRTILKFNEYAETHSIDIKFVHIPKTIDNDLLGTDFSPGYPSAAKFTSTLIPLIAKDILSLKQNKRVELIEIMGGNQSWLSISANLYKEHTGIPDLAFFPTHQISVEEILQKIDSAYKNVNRSIIVTVPDHMQITNLTDNSFISQDEVRSNKGGISAIIAKLISENLGYESKITVPNMLFRITPGVHLPLDCNCAYSLGEAAIQHGLQGYSGGMVNINRVSSDPYLYTIGWHELHQIAGVERSLDKEFWNADKLVPTVAFKEYIYPIIGHEDLELAWLGNNYV